MTDDFEKKLMQCFAKSVIAEVKGAVRSIADEFDETKQEIDQLKIQLAEERAKVSDLVDGINEILDDDTDADTVFDRLFQLRAKHRGEK